MDKVYQSLGFDDEFDFIYQKDFPGEKKKEVSKEAFREFARKVIKEGLPRKNFLEIMARTKFDLRAVEVVASACNDSESKIGFESVDPALFSVADPGLIASLVRYINRTYTKEFVTGVLKRGDIFSVDKKSSIENLNDWIAREEKYYDALENVWGAYFVAPRREVSARPKVVVKDKSAYASRQDYVKDVVECIRGIELTETFKGEAIYSKAKAFKLGGYPRLERYIFHRTRACMPSNAVEDKTAIVFFESD